MTLREILPFGTALERAQELGFVKELVRVQEGVYTGKVPPNISPVTLARIMAINLPGQGYPLKAGGGITWSLGSNPYGTLLDPKTLHEVRLAQDITRSIVGADYVERWTFGGLARQLLRYVRPGKQAEGYTGDAERLRLGTPYGYSECVPGLHEGVTYYDASAYYYTMLKRLPSLNVYCGRKRLEWIDTDPEEWGRWRTVVLNVAEVKPLRNVLAGNMAGPTPGDEGLTPLRVYWHEKTGKVRADPVPHEWGRFRAAGLLLVRSGAELLMHTCHAGGSEVVYANVDAIHTKGTLPTVWADHGFAVRIKAEGNSDTCHRGSYKVGAKQTLPYAQGQRAKIPEVRLPIPPVQYASWLAG